MAVRKLTPKHSKEIGALLETTDYSIFKLAPFNRNAKKVRALVDSMQAHGFQSIITCDRKMRVADGQHRIIAARLLNIPVKYVILTDINVNDVVFLSNLQTGKAWTPADYVKAFSDQGNLNYKRLKKFYESNKFSVTFALSLVSGNELTHKLKKGVLIFSPKQYTTTSKIALLLNDIFDAREGQFRRLLKRTKVAPALKELVTHKNYKHSHFLNVLEQGNGHAIYAVGSVDSARRMLSNIYNSGLSRTSTKKVSL